MVTFAITLDASKLNGDFKRIRETMPRINRRILSLICEATIARSNKDYLRGSKSGLHWITGNLARSESYSVQDWSATIIVGAKYGAIHEFGGTIVPVRAKFLHFTTKDGREVFAKKVTMPKRPFLGPSLHDMFTTGQASKIADGALQNEIDKITGGSG